MLFRGLDYELVTGRASREVMGRKVTAKQGCAAYRAATAGPEMFFWRPAFAERATLGLS